MKKTKTVLKFWSGAYPDKLEKWLEHMESIGWRLVKVGWIGVKFTFEKGEPSSVSYSLDYRYPSDAEYLGLLEDAGWQLIFNSSGWLIWRIPYEGAKPEMYTDTDSLIQRNERLLKVYGVLMLTQITLAVANMKNLTIFPLPLMLLYIALLSIIIIAFIQTFHANRKLKSKAKKL